MFTQKIIETLSMTLYFLVAVYTFWYMSHFDAFEWHKGTTESVAKQK